MGPDERVYLQQARVVKERGVVSGFRLLARRYLRDVGAEAYPSPLRWLWILALPVRWPRAVPLLGAVAATSIAVRMSGSLIAGILVALSPLLFIASRRVFQDAPVAALVLLGLHLAATGNAAWLAVTVVALLATKEVAALSFPAIAIWWWFFGHAAEPLLLAIGCGCVAWATITFALFGRQTLPLIKKALSGHVTIYTTQHQRGAAHRLLVDLALVSPLALALSLWFGSVLLIPAIAIVAMHALSPVRNVRTVLAADLLLRAGLGLALSQQPIGWAIFCLAILGAYDVVVSYMLRNVYDPVTSSLASALRMIPSGR